MNNNESEDKDIIKAKDNLNKLKGNSDYLRHGLSEEEKNEYGNYYENVQKKKINASKKKQKIIQSIVYFFVIIALAFLGFKGYTKYLRPVDAYKKIDSNSIHYLNDLYQPTGWFFDHLLSEEERYAYLDWIKSIKNYDKYYHLNYDYFKGKSYFEIEDSLNMIRSVMIMEHPELFYYNYYQLDEYNLDKERTFDETGLRDLKVTNQYLYPFKFIADIKYQRLLREVDDFTKNHQDENLLTKIKSVYDYFGKKKLTGAASKDAKTAYSALTSNRTTCESIALGSQILFQHLGIDSMLAIGTKEFERYFNVIKLDDGYYFFDACVAIEEKEKGNLANYYGGYLLENYYDYTTGIYQIREDEMGKSHIYRNLQ